MPRILTLVASTVLVGLATLTVGTPAGAESDHYDVVVRGHQVVVTAHGTFHVNREYPWKLAIGDAKFDKAKFSFAEKTATIEGLPRGTGELRGAVCNSEGEHQVCETFKANVSIP